LKTNFEKTNPICERNLKKQSQFLGGQNGAKPYIKVDYSNMPTCGAGKNKPKQSQFHGS